MKRLSVVAGVVLMLMLVLPRGGGSALEVSMSPLASCVPDCTGIANGGMVTDPLNCHNYYLCLNGQPGDHLHSCGSNSHFDPDLLQCVTGSDCDSVCGDGGRSCAMTCDESSAVVADPFNCSIYYPCAPTMPALVQCPDEFPYFDGTGCTDDDSVCCTPYCGVDCDGSGFYFTPDPYDCTAFYVCETGVVGDPGSAFHYSCGPGEYYNILLGMCVVGDPDSCTTLCDAATGGGRRELHRLH